MRRSFALAVPVFLAAILAVPAARAQECAGCHRNVTPNIVSDWELSRHRTVDVDCFSCHGGDHTSEKDVKMARIPTVATCAECHAERVAQFKAGKHSLAWASMKAMPATRVSSAICRK